MKVYVDTVGCRLNQAEIEMIAQQFSAAGHVLVSVPDEADLAVLNTCTVTAKADADSRSQLRRLQRAGVKRIILTGCWASLQADEASTFEGVQQVVLNAQKDHLAEVVLTQLLHQNGALVPPQTEAPIPYKGLSGKRHRTRAFIKVQDGCDDHCTFCITRIARGPARSRTVEEVLGDVRSALARGAKEVVLSGVQLAAWGKDLHHLPPSRRHLRALIETIMEQTAPPRLRLSSLEAWHLDKSFFSIWEDKRICRHLHLPLQSGSNETLKRMGRRMRREAFAALVEDALQQCSDLAITTDIMVGFPGETEEEFAASLDFVQRMNFAGGHVFTYSERTGTPAAAFQNPVPISVRKDRNALMRAVLLQSARQYRQRFVGTVRSVLWERAEPLAKEENCPLLNNSAVDTLSAQAVSAPLGENSWRLEGLTDNYLRVKVLSSQHLWNEITEVLLDETNLFLEE